MPFARLPALAALAALGISCRSSPPSAIDSAMAACVPPGAVILAGVNLDRLRASPLQTQLPPAAGALLQPFHDASSLLAASSGSEYLVLTRGSFQKAPPGAVLLANGLAAAGSPDWVSAAQQRHHSGQGPRSALLGQAEPLAGSSAIWMVAAGSANLPVTGNADNINRLLHTTRYSTLSVRFADNVEMDVVGVCATADSAQHLEETIRAFIGLGASATARQPAVSGLLRRISVSRAGTAVHIALSTEVMEMDELLRLF